MGQIEDEAKNIPKEYLFGTDNDGITIIADESAPKDKVESCYLKAIFETNPLPDVVINGTINSEGIDSTTSYYCPHCKGYLTFPYADFYENRIKGLERTKDALARAVDSLQDENERLKAELKELRSKTVLHDSENLRVTRFETDDGQVITQVTPKTSQIENKRETDGNKNFS